MICNAVHQPIINHANSRRRFACAIHCVTTGVGQTVFAEHALEEADHPDSLLRDEGHGLLTGRAAAVPATQETLNCTAFSWRR